MSVWIDITTAASFPPPATGIPRVEWNLADAACALRPDVRLCLYEARLGRYSEVPVDGFRRLVAARTAGVAGSVGDTVELDVHRHERRASGGAGIFGRGDVVVSCGFDWRPELANLAQLYALRDAIGLRVVTVCHDLIAIRFPHFIPGMVDVFAPYLAQMLQHADHVMCISRCSRDDLLDWAEATGARTPATSVMPLGSVVADAADVADPRVAALLGRPFLLTVGTLERRKNHEVLCRAYTRLVDWGVRDLPPLVFVGLIGHGGQALVDDILADPRLTGRVVALGGVSEAALAALYRGCRFTLFPSLYEGWGLPVTESLAYGKFCLASDRGSLREAGGDLAEYVDPWHVDDWAMRIQRYLGAPDALARHESRIRRHGRSRPWSDTAAHALAVADALA